MSDDDDEDDDDNNDNNRNKNKRKRRGVQDSDDVVMGDDEQNDSKMQELEDDDNANKNKRMGRKRKNVDSEVGTKRVRRSQTEDDTADNSESVGLVTTKISNYFRANRTGQVEKRVLLEQINKDSDAEMS